MKIKLLLIVLLVNGMFAVAQTHTTPPLLMPGQKGAADKEIEWLSFSEAVKRSAKEPRKLLIDVYTKWCGWCKHMDATTYTDPRIVDYVGKKFYAVKFDAETRDTLKFKNPFAPAGSPESQEKKFVYKPEMKVNEFAYSILNGQMAYPTTVFMDERYSILSPVAGFINNEVMGQILHFYGDEMYKKMSWEDFQKANPVQPK